MSLWQQVHSTSFICLSQEMVRSLERAKETYQTSGGKKWAGSIRPKEVRNTVRVVIGKQIKTHFRFIFNLHAGKNGSTKLLKPLCDGQNLAKVQPYRPKWSNQKSTKIIMYNINVSVTWLVACVYAPIYPLDHIQIATSWRFWKLKVHFF